MNLRKMKIKSTNGVTWRVERGINMVVMISKKTANISQFKFLT